MLDSNIDTRWLGVSSTDTTDGPVKMVVFEDYETSYAAIESQSDTVESNMDTLAENTYSAYQRAKPMSDLVDERRRHIRLVRSLSDCDAWSVSLREFTHTARRTVDPLTSEPARVRGRSVLAGEPSQRSVRERDDLQHV